MLKKENTDTLNQRLKKAREQLHLTGKEVAGKAGINYQTYMNYEKGSSLPTAENLVRISNILGVSTDYLLKGNLSDNAGVYNNARLDLFAIMKKKQASSSDSSSSNGFDILNLLYPYPEDKEQREFVGTDITPEVNRLKVKLLDKNASFGSIPIDAKTRQTFFIRFNQLVNELLFQNYFNDDKEKATGGDKGESETPANAPSDDKQESNSPANKEDKPTP